MQDSTGGLFIYRTNAPLLPVLEAGQIIEVDGFSEPGGFAPIVRSGQITVRARTATPEVNVSSFDELAGGARDSEWVGVEAIVRAAYVAADHLNLEIHSAYRVQVFVPGFTNQPPPADLVDARVRMFGVWATAFNSENQLIGYKLFVPSLQNIRLVTPARPDPFSLETQPIALAMRFSGATNFGHRIKVAGVVTAREGSGTFYVQDQTGGIRALTRSGESLDPGDRVEVVGFPQVGGAGPTIEEAMVRRLGQRDGVQPVRIASSAALSDAWDGNLITITGELTQNTRRGDQAELTVHTDAQYFTARLPGTNDLNALARLKPGSRLALTGVCTIQLDADHRPASAALLLRGPPDVQVLRGAPWWTLPRAAAASGVMAMALLAWRMRGLQRETRLREQYRLIFEHANDLICLQTVEGAFVALNQAWERLTGYALEDLRGVRLVELLAPEYHAPYESWLAKLPGGPPSATIEVELLAKDARRIWIEIVSRLIGHGEESPRIESIARDVSARKNAERRLAAQRDLLERVAAGIPLIDSLDAICRFAEAEAPTIWCSILLVDETGTRLRPGVAPTLPAEYCRAIDVVPIGPNEGSCGTAAFRRAAVVVADIETDPLWVNCRALALRHGLRACWSTPVFSGDGAVLAVFAMYYGEPRRPTPDDQRLIELVTHTASIALQRHRAEEATYLARARAQLYLDIAQTMFVSLAADQTINLVNRRACETLGYTQEELVGRDFFELSPPATDSEPLRNAFRHAMAGTGELPRYVESPVLTKSGAQRLIGWHNILVRDPSGRIIGALSSAEDITEQKQTEEALRHSQARFERLFQSSPLAASLTSVADRRLLDVNDRFLELIGRRREEVVGRTMDELGVWSDPRQGAALAAMVRSEGVARNFEARFRRATGAEVDVLIHAQVVLLESGPALLKQANDVSDRKRAEAARQTLEGQLRQSQKMEAVGQLAGGIAHDFNNLLTVIRGNASLMQEGQISAEESGVGLIEIQKAADRAANLTRQLLMFSRRRVFQPKPIDLNGVIGQITRMLQRLIGEHISLTAELIPEGAFIHADPGMIEQVIVNLVVNSRDAMPKGGRLIIRTESVTFDASIAESQAQRRPGEFLRLSIVDTGAGIPPDILPRIFEPFFTTKEIGQGSGLGLATVFGIVQQHQGWLEVESAPGAGASFHAYLPRVNAPPSAGGGPDQPTSVIRGKETLLVVEDEASVRELLEHLLRRHGYTPLLACDGPTALEIWRECQADIALLLTDMVMPGGIGGGELAARLRQEKPGMPVILCSGYSRELLGGAQASQPGQTFLEKPYAPADLLKAIRASLDASSLAPPMAALVPATPA